MKGCIPDATENRTPFIVKRHDTEKSRQRIIKLPSEPLAIITAVRHPGENRGDEAFKFTGYRLLPV
jgi:hypothetical protein